MTGVFDVRDYGAVGDGKTDDAPAIRRALQAARRAGGGTVVLEKRTYLFGENIEKPDGVDIEGAP